MNLERITMSNTAAVVKPCQPKIVENKMTLIEKLEQVIVEHNAEFNKIIKDATDHQKIAHTAVLAGLLSAIKVAKQHSNWISVDERLPEDEQEVLTYVADVTFGAYITVSYYNGNGRIKYWNNIYLNETVTHWQPLPKIPNQGE